MILKIVESEVHMVKHTPSIAANQQPTIAIMTDYYCEPLAVDAMMNNKSTFIKYKSEGRTIMAIEVTKHTVNCFSTEILAFYSYWSSKCFIGATF